MTAPNSPTPEQDEIWKIKHSRVNLALTVVSALIIPMIAAIVWMISTASTWSTDKAQARERVDVIALHDTDQDAKITDHEARLKLLEDNISIGNRNIVRLGQKLNVNMENPR